MLTFTLMFYCRPAKVISWHFSKISSFRIFLQRGIGFFKHSKSSGLSSQRVTFLGLIFDSVKMEFEIPSEKLARLMEGAKFLLKARRFLIRTLASSVGLLQSFRLVIGLLVSLMCRSLYDNIKSAQYWSSYIKLSDLAGGHSCCAGRCPPFYC